MPVPYISFEDLFYNSITRERSQGCFSLLVKLLSEIFRDEEVPGHSLIGGQIFSVRAPCSIEVMLQLIDSQLSSVKGQVFLTGCW